MADFWVGTATGVFLVLPYLLFLCRRVGALERALKVAFDRAAEDAKLERLEKQQQCPAPRNARFRTMHDD